MDAEADWHATLGQLQMEMPRALFDAWVRDTRFPGWNEGVFTVGVSNDYACNWLDNWGEDAGEKDNKSRAA